MLVRCTAILGVLLFAAACSQTPVKTPMAEVTGTHPATIRASAGTLWVARTVGTEPRPAWALPSKGKVEGLDVTALGAAMGYVVTFHQGGVTWIGYLDPKLAPAGTLQPMAGGENGATRVAIGE